MAAREWGASSFARRLQFETRLEPRGLPLNNYMVMHARSEFDDWEEPKKKRLMHRMWLHVEHKPRPIVREIHIYESVAGRSGIDPQPGACRQSRSTVHPMPRCRRGKR